jgi:radical SAM superfamily enzyme YgiQ (UPF0313 family)
MKILLINPLFPNSLWSFSGLSDLAGSSIGQPPLGLVTVAALTPPGHELQVIDENIEPVDFEAEVDLVALGPFNVQFARAKEIAERFRARGIPVAVGGPYVSLDPEAAEDHFDHTLSGEAEFIWPKFVNDLEAGQAEQRYVQEGNIDITASPVPRLDLLRLDSYLAVYLQASRGCPFTCEFCDIIITDGRVPRLKPVSQVMAEIESVYKLRGHGGHIGFSDANFIGSPKYAEELLTAMADWNRERGYPLKFGAEMTLNVADKPKLLELFQAANFLCIFIGIESPRTASLLETKKAQNARGDILEKIHRIQAYNIAVDAGMIVGFDSDDSAIFQEQFDFLQKSGISLTTCGVLTALKGTPLYTRLKNEGRLRDDSFVDTLGHGAADLNFEPHLMSREDLLAGYNWLIRSLYSYDNYAERLLEGTKHFSKQLPPGQRGLRAFDAKGFKILARAIPYYLFRAGSSGRRFFLGTLWKAVRRGDLLNTIVPLLTYLVMHKHFFAFVNEVHGGLEAVPVDPPEFGPVPERAVPPPEFVQIAAQGAGEGGLVDVVP